MLLAEASKRQPGDLAQLSLLLRLFDVAQQVCLAANAAAPRAGAPCRSRARTTEHRARCGLGNRDRRAGSTATAPSERKSRRKYMG